MGGPHHGLQVLERGQPLERASAAMLLLHGRGATAEDIFIDYVRVAVAAAQEHRGDPGMAHVASADEIAHVRRLMAALTRRDRVERPASS